MNCNCKINDENLVNNIKIKLLDNNKLLDMSYFFKIFSDPTRLKIINILLHSKMCVCDIAHILNMTHSSISHQLSYLKQHKIVKYTKIGKIVYYELDDNHINEIFNKGCEHINE